MTATCTGTSIGHCCHLGDAGVCRFLERGTVPGRRWACGLRRELGAWPAVHADRRYRVHVAPVVRGLVDVDCGDWPRDGETCGECGVTG